MPAMKWDVAPGRDEIALLLEAGFVYRDSKKFAEAREVFRGVRALAPASEIPEVALGTVAFQEGDFETAKKHYLKALELNPRSAWAEAHLGEVELFRKDKEAARRHLNAALKLDPQGETAKMARSLIELLEMVRFQA